MLHYLSFGENGCKEIFHFGNCPLQPEYRPKFTSQKEYTLTDPFLLSACMEWRNVGGGACKDSFRVRI